jgi:hypothetical protein
MAYTPLNQAIFQAAMAGAMAGATGDGIGSGTAPALVAGYSAYALAAFAYAQAYDTNRGSATSGSLENLTTELESLSAFRNRNPTSVVNANVPATWTPLAADVLAAVQEAVTVAGGNTSGVPGNRAWATDQVTTNGQGVGGPTIVLALSLIARGSGIFRWSASAEQAAAAATEVLTWTVTTQTGAAALALAGGTNVTSGFAPAGGAAQFASAAAGTGITVTTGGGGELTAVSEAITIGTAAVGGYFGAGGLVMNGGTAAAPVPFTQGDNVLLLVKVTNSATNRVVASMNASLEEL